MRFDIGTSAWWGAPKKFDREIKERRISWLELFYDLVYVIAISRITHHLSLHLSINGFLEYASLFALIYWGWLNGSLYHDLHGNEGLRTRLMTLWQIMIIAALAITIDHPTGKQYFNTTIVLMIMQFYITYMWWSIGIYDKGHRRFNLPYTILFLLSLALMGLSLVVSQEWFKFLVPLVIICNYSPYFIAHRLLRRSSLDLNLSSSMSERLGLFTIIVFGEVVLGVVNGISELDLTALSTWLRFAFALAIVFALWWLFFTMASNRNAKKGFKNATLLQLLYIPALISLGLIAACFSSLFAADHSLHSLLKIFGYAMTIFFIGISLMMGLLETHDKVRMIIRQVRISLFIVALVFFISAQIIINVNSLYYLLGVIIILVAEILYLNSLYYRLVISETDKLTGGEE
ncbi:MAG: low temperature requirement protein A [Bacteroidetes bacterium]|nr:MAG: low temperature requirement protein A [Bacteroidota bacterium]